MENLLMKYYFKTLFSSIKTFAKEKLFFFIGWIILLWSFWIIIWTICYIFFSYLINNFPWGHIFAPNLISFVVYIMFLVFVFSGFVASISTLYKSREINFLISMPFESYEIFRYWFLKIVFFLLLPALFLLLPIFFSYWIVSGYSIFYYLLSLFVIFAMVYLAVFFSVVLFLLLSAFVFSFKRIYINWFLLSVLVFMLFSALLVFFSAYENMTDQETFLEQYILTFDYENIFLPWNWLNAMFVNFVQWNYSLFFSWFLFTAVSIVFFYALIWFLSQKYYYQSKENFAMYSIFPKKKTVSLISFFWKNPKINLLKKDFLLYMKDPSWLSQFMIFFVLIWISVVVINSITLEEIDTPMTASIITLSTLALTWFMISATALKIVYPNISIEWKSFWILRTIPVWLNYIYFLKFIFFVVFFVLVGLLISQAYASIIWFIDVVYIFILLMLLPLIFVVVSLYFTLWNIYPDFNETNPSQIATSMPAFGAVIISNIFIIIVCLLIYSKVFSYYENVQECEILWLYYFWDVLVIFYPVLILLWVFISWIGYRQFIKL